MKRYSLVTLFLIAFLFVGASSAQDKKAAIAVLMPYTKCEFSDDLEIVRVDRIFAGKNRPRAVETANSPKEVSRIASYRVMIAYPKHDYYMANIRPELSATNEYETDKVNVVDWLTKLAGDDKEFSSSEGLVKTTINGFDIYNYHRRDFFFESRKSEKNPTGGVDSVGTSVMFSDLDKTITTIYFFNTKKPKKNPVGFNSIEDWIGARDTFLKTYTNCIDQNRKSQKNLKETND